LQLTAFNIPVEIGSVMVRPGDIIIADKDGVVSILREALNTLMGNMKTMFEVEEGMERGINSGASAAELSAIIAKKKPKK